MGVTDSSLNDEKFCGFRIYKIIPEGPLHKAGLKELEDFIIPPEDVKSHKISFSDYILQNYGKLINLTVYSLLKGYFYSVNITPYLNWSENKDQGYLGASVRYENWLTANKYLLRVISVNKNSPAEKLLNLTPMEDYIIAIRPENEDFLTLNVDVTDPLSLFANYLFINKNKVIEFYIYNSKNGARITKAKIETEILGCDVAYGKLHEFPKLVNNLQPIHQQREETTGVKSPVVNHVTNNTTKEIDYNKKEDDIEIVEEKIEN